MLLSSGVVWRHRTMALFRAECPDGDEPLQRLLVERLDEALDWLERAAGTAGERGSGNPFTEGRRFDPRRLTSALAEAAGDVRLAQPVTALPEGEVVLATGGFAARLARERGLPLRAAPGSDGDGLRLGTARGGTLTAGMGEFYGRAMPAPPAVVGETDFVRAAQLYGRFAHVVADTGAPVFDREPSWSETDLVQAIARVPGARAWYAVDAAGLGQRVRERSVEEMVAVAEELGGEVRRADSVEELGLGRLWSPKLHTPPFAAVRVAAAVTHTIGGLRVDCGARVLRADRSPVEGLYAAGVDAGGLAAGGYASGLATALVLGLAAADSIAG